MTGNEKPPRAAEVSQNFGGPTISPPIEKVLSRLEGVKGGNSSWTARCPSHDDKRNSLSVSEADGKVLLNCHAGCETENILVAMDLELKDLFPDGGQAKKQKKEIIATYDYVDESGHLLYQAVRLNPKGFYQRRPDGKGGLINNLNDTRRVLYRLPEVIEAVAAGQTIHVVEGEKDADNLDKKLGLVATCNCGGAGKWLDSYSQALAGAHVVIIPDNDTTGHKHAQDVKQALEGVAADVKVIHLPGLPAKGDVSDWIAAGGTVEGLRELVKNPPPEPEPPASKSRPKRPRKDDEKPRQTSFHADDSFLYDEVLLGGHHLTFLRYEIANGQVEEADEIILEDGKRIIPRLPSDENELLAVLLPTGAADYGDTKSLLTAIQEHINRYVDVSPNFRKFASYYVLLTYLYDKMNTLPYLRALGDTGCGKSRLIDTVGRLCYKSTVVSGSVTPASIYRMIRRWGGTVVLDEADMKNSDEYNEVITILNCGFERGRPVIRAMKDNPDKLQFLPTYCPKVFGTRRRFKDAALEARCLTEIMQETDRTDIPVFLGKSFYREQANLRNKLLMFRFRNWHGTDAEQAGAFDLGSDIEPRLRQVSSAFGAVFAGMDDVLEDYKAFIRELQRELIEQRASTLVGQVVETLFSLSPGTNGTNGADGTFQTPTGERLLHIQSKDIAEKTGKTSQAVGQILKNLGLKTKQDRIDGQKGRWLVYDDAVLSKLRRRYVLSDDSVPSVPFVPSVPGDSDEPEPELSELREQGRLAI
ncbi:MAG: hypothetical protein M0Z32_01020 [Actinomycetota bacterium]|nr:hypothetical protein [Actinomycetota bacterium]MCL6093539.1 hypothetical protein [Actinomycetota bacterium]MDA8166326.1 hypothetical protein [Actinomycetota bacterium]